MLITGLNLCVAQGAQPDVAEQQPESASTTSKKYAGLSASQIRALRTGRGVNKVPGAAGGVNSTEVGASVIILFSAEGGQDYLRTVHGAWREQGPRSCGKRGSAEVGASVNMGVRVCFC